jgi:hypothetical protein
MKQILLILSIAAGLVSNCSGQKTEESAGQAYPFVPAFFDRQEMHLFPLNGNEGKMALPIILTGFAYGQDGRSLYGFDKAQTGLYKIELTGCTSATSLGLQLHGERSALRSHRTRRRSFCPGHTRSTALESVDYSSCNRRGRA